MDSEDQLVALRRAFVQRAEEHLDLPEVVDINAFQERLKRIRERNQQAIEEAPQAWARKVADIQEQVSKQRLQMEDALLEGMLLEEQAMLDRLEDMERNLRNMIRLYKQLMDERNSMVAGIERLHSWIRQLETKQKRKPHRDHSRELAQKFFIEYLSKQAWIFDNSGGWEIEEPQPRGGAKARTAG